MKLSMWRHTSFPLSSCHAFSQAWSLILLHTHCSSIRSFLFPFWNIPFSLSHSFIFRNILFFIRLQFTCNLFLGLHKGRQATFEKPLTALKREHPTFQNRKFLKCFLFFYAIFTLLDPDPADKKKYESGSETLVWAKSIIHSSLYRHLLLSCPPPPPKWVAC